MVQPPKKLRDNIARNIERANRQYQRQHGTEPPQSVKDYHDKMIRGAEYTREREQNRKRGVK